MIDWVLIIGTFAGGFGAAVMVTTWYWSRLCDEAQEQTRRLIETWKPDIDAIIKYERKHKRARPDA